MYCSRCGNQFQDTNKFCPACGQEVGGAATTPVKAIATGEMTELDIVKDSLSAEYEIRGGTLKGQVQLGAHTFDNPRIAFHPGVRIGNVGSRLLRDFRITLDAANTRARFERTRAAPDQPAAARSR